MTSATILRRPTPVPVVPTTVFTGPGPAVSVYLTTEASLPRAADQVALRWKTLRACLAADGAPDSALAAIDPLTEDSHRYGQTLVALANPDGLVYTAHLPQPPETDSACVASLPQLLPLLAATQMLMPHVVVITDRLGAELIAVLPHEADVHHEIEGEELHVTRSAPGGWSQRRFQQRAENRWETNAREVSDALARLVDTIAPRLVVVSGDVRAVQFLRKHLPSRVNELLTEVQGDYTTLDEAINRSEKVVEDLAATDTAALLADYHERRPQGLAVDGPGETLKALHAGQVDTVLLDPTRTAGQSAWFGPDLAQAAANNGALLGVGVPRPRPAPLGDVAVRAAAGTGAAVRIIPTGAPDLPSSGIAALLRYQ